MKYVAFGPALTSNRRSDRRASLCLCGLYAYIPLYYTYTIILYTHYTINPYINPYM